MLGSSAGQAIAAARTVQLPALERMRKVLRRRQVRLVVLSAAIEGNSDSVSSPSCLIGF